MGLLVNRIDSQRLLVMLNRLAQLTPLGQRSAQVIVGVHGSRIDSQRLSVMFNCLSQLTSLGQRSAQVVVASSFYCELFSPRPAIG